MSDGITYLKREGQYEILIAEGGRTAHPYPTEEWGDGHHNHPSLDLVLNPWEICLIPEVGEFHALAKLLLAANVLNERLRTTACDVGIIDVDATKIREFRRAAGALLIVALREDVANKRRENLISLAVRIAAEMDWESVPDMRMSLCVEPYKAWYGCEGYYCLVLEYRSLGRDDADAWAKAGAYADVVASVLERA